MQSSEAVRSQTIVVRLRLRDKHAGELDRQAAAVNFVWNYCNEISQRFWKERRRSLSKYELQKLTSGSSKDLDIHAHTIQKVCYQFISSRDAARHGDIRWRGKKSLGWIPFNTGHVTFDGGLFRFRGAFYETMHKEIRMKEGQPILAGSFNQDAKGHWYINCPISVEAAATDYSEAVGIDLGLKTLATLSDGNKINMPTFYRQSEKAIAAAQRAKKTKRARAINLKVANRRKDFLHKASLALAKGYGTIVIGDVSASKLAKTRMAKSVRDAGWAGFKIMISYKALMHGGRTIETSEVMTSQTCSECGCLPASRPRGIAGLRIREWTCDDCGSVHDRDVNAARNILRVGLDTLVEGAKA